MARVELWLNKDLLQAADLAERGIFLQRTALIGFGKSFGGFCVIHWVLTFYKKHLLQVSFQREMWGKTCRTAKVPNFCPSLPLTKGPKVDFLPTLTGSIWGLHFTAVSHLAIFDILTRRRSHTQPEVKVLARKQILVWPRRSRSISFFS